MGYVVLFGVALVLLYFVAWALVAAFLLFFVPALVVVVPAVAAAGALTAAALAVLTLTGHRDPPDTVTPDQTAAGTAKLPKLPDDAPFGRDRAWASYFSAQARVDLTRVRHVNTTLLAQGWRWIGELFENSWPGRITVALVLAPLWLGFSVGALLATAAIVGAGVAVLFTTWVLWTIPTGVSRAGDQLVRRFRGASGSCPSCYHVTMLPAFACPGCGQVHRDIRPGRLGGLWRRCHCGTVLPTGVLRMARKSPPSCPRCEETLRAGAAVVTDVRLPVFGPVSAGKTRLVYTGLLAVRDRVAAQGGVVDFVDEDSKQAFDHAVALITAGGDTVKTPAGELPPAITARYTAGRRRALLHLFDAAGEFYADRDDNTDLEFLDHAQGLVFVVDPFSIPWVRDRIGESSASAVVAKANPARESPERVYHVTAKRLLDYGVATGKRRLAVTVVKSDLLAGFSFAGDLTPGTVRDWLMKVDLDNLVLSAEREFGEVRYFMVASMAGTSSDDALSPAAPLAWLSAGAGLRLWPDPEASGRPEAAPKESEETV